MSPGAAEPAAEPTMSGESSAQHLPFWHMIYDINYLYFDVVMYYDVYDMMYYDMYNISYMYNCILYIHTYK